MGQLLRSLWRYRYFIYSSIRNDFRVRFIRSKLGSLWMVIHPLMQVVIFATILSEVLSAKLPGINNKYAYALYLMAGTLCWSLFSEILTKCVSIFVDNADLLKKLEFPRICLPVIVSGTALLNNVLLLLAIFLVFALIGHFPGVQTLWLPLLMLFTAMIALSVGLLLGIFNVFMRDISQVVPVVLQALFWLTPIVYSIDILTQQAREIFSLNPLYPLVTSYQNVLLYNKPPAWGAGMWMVLAGAVLLAGLALAIFRRASSELVDAL